MLKMQERYYCSKVHIAQDWPSHKAYCKRVSNVGDNIFDAILFGVNETKPRPIKIPWTYGPVDEDEVGGMWQKLEKAPWFMGKDCHPRHYYIQMFGANGPSLGYTLVFWFNDSFLINGSALNRCIQTVTGGNTMHPWSGNIFTLRAMDLNSDFYEDAVMEEDLAPLIRYFKDYSRE